MLAAALLVAACHTDSPTRTEDVTVWQPRGRWTGRELLQTDPFSSASGLLRVTWQARSLSPAAGTLRIVLHSDVSGRSLAPVVEQQGPGSGMKYLTEDPRSFFLVIESKNLEWAVEVAEGVPATRSIK
jgi:hypothetical protein